MYQKRDFKELYMYVATLRVQKEQKTKENGKNPSFSMLISCQHLPSQFSIYAVVDQWFG